MTNANQEPMLLLKNAVVCISAGGRPAKSLELHQAVALFVWNLLCQVNACSREYIDTPRSQKEGRWGTPILKRSILGKRQTQQSETGRCQGTGSRRREREWHRAGQAKGCLSAVQSAEGVRWITETTDCMSILKFILLWPGRADLVSWVGKAQLPRTVAVQVMNWVCQQEPGKQPWREAEAQLCFSWLQGLNCVREHHCILQREAEGDT